MGATLVLISGSTLEDLRGKLHALIRTGLPSVQLYSPNDCRILAVVASQASELGKKLRRALELLGEGEHRIDEDGLYYEPVPFGPDCVAFLFPGQGSQSVGMLQPLRTAMPTFERYLSANGNRFQQKFHYSLLDIIYAEKTAANDERLLDTRQAQPALGLVSASLSQALRDLGVRPSYTAGHSYGELPALHAAGIVEADFLLELSKARGEWMGTAGDQAPGAMLSVFARSDAVERLMNDNGIDAVVAIDNADEQTIVSGSMAQIDRMEQACAGTWKTIRLKTSAAFHSPLMADAERKWRSFLADRKHQFGGPHGVKVYSNVSAVAYRSRLDELPDLLAKQLTHRVRWQETCAQLYEDGARIFIEVGPSNVLTRLLGGILSGKPHVSIPMDPRHNDGGRHIGNLIGRLAGHHVPVRAEQLFDARLYDDYLRLHTERNSGMDQPNESGRQRALEHYFKSNQWMVRTFLEEQGNLLSEQLQSMSGLDQSKLMQMVMEQRRSVVMGAFEAQKAGVSSFYSEGGDVKSAIPSSPSAAVDVYPVLAAEQVAAASMLEREEEAGIQAPLVQPGMTVRAVMVQLTREIAAAAGKPLHDITPTSSFDKLNVDIFTLENIFDRMFAEYDRYPLFKQELLHASQLDQVERLLHYITDDHSLIADIRRYGYTYELVAACEGTAAAAPDRILLVGMKDAMFDFFREGLSAQGVSVITVHTTETGWSIPGAGDIIRYEDMASLHHSLEALQDDEGSLPSLMFLVPDSSGVLEQASLEQWNARIDQTATALFVLSSLYSQSNGPTNASRFASIVGHGGSCPVSAAARGIARTMAHDLKGKYEVRSIGLESRYMDLQFQQLFRAINDGVSAHDMFVQGDSLLVRKLDSKAAAQRGAEAALNAASLVVVFGGGAGITSEIACAIAERFGCAIVIVGRTSFPASMEYEHIQDDSQLKQAIYRDLTKQLGEGRQVTAATLEQETRRVHRQRALVRTRQRIEQAGGRFYYYSCDVTDHDALTALLAAIEERHGTITGLIHGAGEVNGQRNKTASAFRNNLAIKTSSMFALYQYFRSYPLKFAILFSSISAYAGIPRQSDYASSNEFVNGIASYWNRQADYPVRSIMWSLWTETGIMKNSTHDVERLGLQGITNRQGIQLFMRELDHLDTSDECVMLTHDTMLNYSMP